MFPNQDRNEMRRFFTHAWAKRRQNMPLEPLERIVADVIAVHPEYQAMLEDPERAIGAEWTPERGQTNPFLHMGLHIAIHEQLTTDRPAGILTAYQALAAALNDAHETEHRMMECLGQSLWEASRRGGAPDEHAYLECVRGLARR